MIFWTAKESFWLLLAFVWNLDQCEGFLYPTYLNCKNIKENSLRQLYFSFLPLACYQERNNYPAELYNWIRMDFILNPTDYHLTNGEVLGRDWDDEKCALGIKNPDFFIFRDLLSTSWSYKFFHDLYSLTSLISSNTFLSEF